MPTLNLSRDEHSSSTSNRGTLSSIYIAGLVLIGIVVVALAAWLVIRKLHIRSTNKREAFQGAVFLSDRSVAKEGEAKEPLQAFKSTKGNTFSRNQLTPSVVLPDKVLIRSSPSAPPAGIIEYPCQSGNVPRPSTVSRPFSFALSAGTGSVFPRTQSVDSSRRSWISFLSSSASGSHRSRFSVISSASQNLAPTTGTVRKILQMFVPVLPDELLVDVGEQLTIIQSFDDGWCVVGKEVHGTAFIQIKSLFGQEPTNDNMEIGVVPAWCFLKPVVGLKGERPIRSSSLGITVEMERPGFSSRQEIISWSNF